LEAFEIASIDYLLKPFTLERLRQTVSRLGRIAPERGRPVVGEAKKSAYIYGLGGFYLYTNNKILSWRTTKEKELCAYLIHHCGHSVEGDTIIDALWPESDLKKARSYFYTCISYLRKNFQLNSVQLSVDKSGEGYFLDVREADNDVAEFTAILEQAATGQRLNEHQYERLNELYKGDYLEGCDYHWAMWRREELRSGYVGALRFMQKGYAKHGNLPLAIDCLKRILALEPDSEQDGRELIKLYLHSDHRSEALKVFRRLEQAVRLNFGLELEEATVRLFEKITPNGG
jgi:two-component SAPR family response regulator